MSKSLENTIIYLIGFAGAGKRTVGEALCQKSDRIRMIHNHDINNPIFSLVRRTGKEALSTEVWEYTRRIKETVLEAFVHIARRDMCFVTTNQLHESDPEDREVYERVLEAAEKGKFTFVPVRLVLEREENRRRIISPEREKHFKMTRDDEIDEWHAEDEVLKTGHLNELTLDVTDLSPEQAADAVLQHISALQKTT